MVDLLNWAPRQLSGLVFEVLTQRVAQHLGQQSVLDGLVGDAHHVADDWGRRWVQHASRRLDSVWVWLLGSVGVATSCYSSGSSTNPAGFHRNDFWVRKWYSHLRTESSKPVMPSMSSLFSSRLVCREDEGERNTETSLLYFTNIYSNRVRAQNDAEDQHWRTTKQLFHSRRWWKRCLRVQGDCVLVTRTNW